MTFRIFACSWYSSVVGTVQKLYQPNLGCIFNPLLPLPPPIVGFFIKIPMSPSQHFLTTPSPPIQILY